jgi:DNA adenine methylase
MLLGDCLFNKKLSCLSNTVPFVRWPGGKRWLMPKLQKILTNIRFKRFYEPFLGGGAFYFSFGASPATLADVNAELINAYIHVRDHPTVLLEELRRLKINQATYEMLRKGRFESSIYRAVRFLYLNRTCFSGVYRVNANNEFNVPYGGGERTPAILWESDLLINASKALRGSRIICSDFESVMSEGKEGDLIYCDPTYTVSHNDNGFRRYNEKHFSWEDQKRLAKACLRAKARGCTVIVSNARHSEIKALYRGARMHVFRRWSGLSSNPNKRTEKEEYVFVLSPRP